MFRLLLPNLQGILVRETDEVDLLPVLAGVRLDRDESWNLLDELVHAPGCLPVRSRIRSVAQMGLEDDDDLGRVFHTTIRHKFPLPGPRESERRHGLCPRGRPTSPRL